jgi:nucleotide-binding universal stress UspA family protein
VGDDSADVMALARLLARATDGTVLQSTDPVKEAIRRRHPGLVVVRSSPRSATPRDLDALVRDAPCPVAIAPQGYADRAPGALRHVGVAFDGWEESRVALAEAVAVAAGGSADLCLLMVADPRTAATVLPYSGSRDWLLGHRTLADRYLTGVAAGLMPGIRAHHRALEGQVASALAEAADTEELDLLVLGSRRLGPIAGVALGSVSHALLRSPPCPVLVCPRGIAARREPAAPAGAGRALP